MNIFVLHPNPRKAARMQCDKHVVKMVLETTQILSTVMHLSGVKGPYKATHSGHPCTLWVLQSRANWAWLRAHGLSLAKEYSWRYGRRHSCHSVLLHQIPEKLSSLPDVPLTPFVNCTPYKDLPVISAYRKYYLVDKASFATWKHDNMPKWFAEKTWEDTSKEERDDHH